MIHLIPASGIEPTEAVVMETHFDAMEKSLTDVPLEKLARDLKILARDAEELMVATAADMSERAKDARLRLKEALSSVHINCRDLEEQATAAAKATDQWIREYPYPSLGIVFGFGLVVGLWLNRR
jgi:ElaB/YqjD/DUF883 family membrane-anchored ribosome-binding protein